MIANHIEVSRTARYWALGEGSDHITEIWYVLHGYGQLAQFFLRKFQGQERSGRLIIAPEGAHRFYKEGYSGRVGASWMTKEDRVHDIQDYIRYLDHLHDKISQEHPGAEVKVLGFSQGAATASRWVNYGNVNASALCLWASIFPPDMELSMDKLTLPIYLVYASDDEFLHAEATQQHIALLQYKGLAPIVIRFEGRHDIRAEPLQQLAEIW